MARCPHPRRRAPPRPPRSRRRVPAARSRRRSRPGAAAASDRGVRPPSTRSTSTGTLSRTAATMSATRHAIASSAARAMCAGRDPAVSPAITARASGFHHGAPTPASAGSTRTPAVSSTPRGGRGERGGVGREAEVARQPVEQRAGGEHAAVDRPLQLRRRLATRSSAAARRAATDARRRRAPARTRRCRTWPSPARGARTRRRPAPPAGRRSCARSGSSTGQRSGVEASPRSPAVSRDRRQHAARDAEDLEQLASQSRRDRAACATPSRGRSRSRRRAGRTGTSRRSRSAAIPAASARAHGLVVLEQPRDLAGREVRVERHPAERGPPRRARRLEPVEDLLRALVLPGDDRRQRAAAVGVPGEHRLALVIEAAGDRSASGGRARAPPATASTTAARISSGSCSTQPGAGMRQRLLAPRLGHRCAARASYSAALTAEVPSSIPSSRVTLPRPPGSRARPPPPRLAVALATGRHRRSSRRAPERRSPADASDLARRARRSRAMRSGPSSGSRRR